MKLKIYQVDAFTDKIFSGNPAAVCSLNDEWLDDAIMRQIAMENNLSETVFYICKNNNYHIRWFSPTTEVDLCGHATLATGYVLFNYENYPKDEIRFSSKSGDLIVKKQDDYLIMDFPTDTIEKVNDINEFKDCFDILPTEVYKGKTDYILVFENEDQIRDIKFDLLKIKQIKARGIIITARGRECDFVSRFFAPQSGINEDPVTGSAHTTLTPFWSKVLNKKELKAIQLSYRKGELICRNMDERTEISGKAKLYMQGEIEL
jgi:PhzF family phenazine biosynthesis protein